MPSLAQRDASATFALRAGEVCEVSERRTRSAKVFELPPAPDGRRRYRIGAGIGPVHYPDDPFAASPAWHEIDLSLSETNDGSCDWQLTAAGYGVRLWQERSGLPYAAEFSRAGATYTMAPLSLSWQDGDGNEEVIAKPEPGIKPVIDDDAYTITWEDAFGSGLSYGYNCCPDKLYKALVIRDRGALPKPRAIDPARLVLRLWVQWGGGAAPTGNLPRAPSEYKGSSGETDAVIRRSNPYPHKRAVDGEECFWVQKPEAWDSAEEDQQRWALDWWYERRGTEVVLCLALDCTALDAATYPLLMDTAITEEQVGASTDDAYITWSPTNPVLGLDSALIQINISSYYYDVAGFRFTSVPIPDGSTITAANLSVYVYVWDNPHCDIYCEDADDAATFSALDTPRDRTKTTAYASWNDTGLGFGWKTSPDISDPVQEVVDRPGWAQGALMVLTYQPSKTANEFLTRGYDNSPSYAAKLNVTYTEPRGATTSRATVLYSAATLTGARSVAVKAGAASTLARDLAAYAAAVAAVDRDLALYAQDTEAVSRALVAIAATAPTAERGLAAEAGATIAAERALAMAAGEPLTVSRMVAVYGGQAVDAARAMLLQAGAPEAVTADLVAYAAASAQAELALAAIGATAPQASRALAVIAAGAESASADVALTAATGPSAEADIAAIAGQGADATRNLMAHGGTADQAERSLLLAGGAGADVETGVALAAGAGSSLTRALVAYAAAQAQVSRSVSLDAGEQQALTRTLQTAAGAIESAVQSVVAYGATTPDTERSLELLSATLNAIATEVLAWAGTEVSTTLGVVLWADDATRRVEVSRSLALWAMQEATAEVGARLVAATAPTVARPLVGYAGALATASRTMRLWGGGHEDVQRHTITIDVRRNLLLIDVGAHGLALDAAPHVLGIDVDAHGLTIDLREE